MRKWARDTKRNDEKNGKDIVNDNGVEVRVQQTTGGPCDMWHHEHILSLWHDIPYRWRHASSLRCERRTETCAMCTFPLKSMSLRQSRHAKEFEILKNPYFVVIMLWIQIQCRQALFSSRFSLLIPTRFFVQCCLCFSVIHPLHTYREGNDKKYRPMKFVVELNQWASEYVRSDKYTLKPLDRRIKHNECESFETEWWWKRSIFWISCIRAGE